MMNLQCKINLRGVLWAITDISICPAEPDVGIMSAYPEGWRLVDDQGKEADWEPTEEEIDLINNEVMDAYYTDTDES